MKSMQAKDYKRVLMSNDWFSSLSKQVIDKIIALCKVKSIKKGQKIVARNELADGLYCLLDGKVRVSNVNKEGKEMVLTWLSPGTWFGEISLFDGLPRTHDSFTETESTILLLPAQSFHQLLNDHPELYPHFMKQLCSRIRNVFALLDEASGLSLKQQLMKRLLILSNGWRLHDTTNFSLNEHQQQEALSHSVLVDSAMSPSTIEINVSQDALARLLNTSRQTINKLLQELKSEGLISIRYSKIRLENLSELYRSSAL